MVGLWEELICSWRGRYLATHTLGRCWGRPTLKLQQQVNGRRRPARPIWDTAAAVVRLEAATATSGTTRIRVSLSSPRAPR